MLRLLLAVTIGASVAGALPAQQQPTPAPSTSDKYVPPKEIGGDDLDDWIKKLKHSDPSTRENALRVIPFFGVDAKKAIPQMIERMVDRDHSVRLTAMAVLGSNLIDDPKHLKSIMLNLEQLLYHGQSTVRIQAATMAGRLGILGEKTLLPKLLSEFQVRNEYSYEVRKAACFALGRVTQGDAVKGPDRRALLALVHALSDDCVFVRIEAAQSLMMLGNPSEPADQESEKRILLERIIKEPDRTLVIWLRLCLMRLDAKLINPANLNPIADALTSTDIRLRSTAAEALGMMGKDANAKAGNLREGLKFATSDKPEDVDFMVKCLWAIGQMGKDADFMINDIKPLTEHKYDIVKAYAKDALESLMGKKKTN